MSRSRSIRLVGHGVRLALFILAGVAAGRFFLDTLGSRGWGPGTFFGLLLVTGTLSLIWRASLDLRKLLRRKRA